MKNSSNAHLKEIPHSLEAEQNVLGALLSNESAWEYIEGRLEAQDFYFSQNQVIFAAIEKLLKERRHVNNLTVIEELKSLGQLAEAGGVDYLNNLWRETISYGKSIVSFSEIIRDKAILRELISASHESIDEAYFPEGRQSKEILNNAEKRLSTLSNKYSRSEKGGFVHGKVISAQTLKYLSEIKENGSNGITGIPTGFTQLDYYTAGLQGGDLIIIAGRPSMGKTTFGMNIAEFIAQAGKAVAIFSLEMPSRALMMRMFSSLGNIEQQHIRAGALDAQEQSRLMNAIRELRTMPLFIDDESSITISEIRSRARKLHREQGGLGLILIDYLQLIQPEGSTENRVFQMGEISRALKLLAKELNVPLIALSQLNRSVESRDNRRPRMSDIRDSGAIEQDADLIMFVYRDEVYNDNPEVKGNAEIIIGKQRNGELGTVNLKYTGATMKFHNPPPKAEPDFGEF